MKAMSNLLDMAFYLKLHLLVINQIELILNYMKIFIIYI